MSFFAACILYLQSEACKYPNIKLLPELLEAPNRSRQTIVSLHI